MANGIPFKLCDHGRFLRTPMRLTPVLIVMHDVRNLWLGRCVRTACFKLLSLQEKVVIIL
jgi:hypothetical protein